MGVKIVVDTQNLISTSTAVIEKANAYKKLADNLFNEVNNMGSNWQGQDNVAYVNQVNGYKAEFEELDKLLRQYADMLQIVDKEYVKTLNDSYAIANSI